MLSAVIDTLLGGGLQILLLLLGLFPAVDVASLPLAVPETVRNVLGNLNWFIPIGDLMSILTVWIGLLLAVNVAIFVISIVNQVKKG
ncbi:MAG: hypothetical protein UCH28_06400 [Adlercreutzia sp.]|nr:hypothetical protein [Adlercreutzia sp.]